MRSRRGIFIIFQEISINDTFHIRLQGKWSGEAGPHNSYVFRLKLNPHYYNLKLISYNNNKQTTL